MTTKNAPKPSARYIRSLFDYDPATGILTNRLTGEEVGANQRPGNYRKTSVDGCPLTVHGIAWLLQTGEWPISKIDHVNRQPDDNRWCNLRLATDAQNARNRSLRNDSQTGVKGVGYCRRDRRFQTSIMVDGKHINLGRYDTVEEAAAAYREAAEELHGEFAAHNHTPEVLAACPSLEWFRENYPPEGGKPRKTRSDKGKPRATRPNVHNRNRYDQRVHFVGVMRHKGSGQFVAVSPDYTVLSWHDTAEDAARAYDAHVGETVPTNVSERIITPKDFR